MIGGLNYVDMVRSHGQRRHISFTCLSKITPKQSGGVANCREDPSLTPTRCRSCDRLHCSNSSSTSHHTSYTKVASPHEGMILLHLNSAWDENVFMWIRQDPISNCIISVFKSNNFVLLNHCSCYYFLDWNCPLFPLVFVRLHLLPCLPFLLLSVPFLAFLLMQNVRSS